MITNFQSQVYNLLKQVPAGKVTTYKLLAQALNTRAYQAIGTAMKNNPYAPEVPCHRVVKNDGTIGGFMGATSGKNIEKKRKMLMEEGIEFDGDRVVDFKKKSYEFLI